MVDECHSAGVVGSKGRGVSELYNLYGRIDIHTGTLGKAFGGAIGGFTTGRKEIIDMLRQRSRPYLFSNSLPPAVVGAGIEVFKMLDESDELHTRLMENVTYFRDKMLAAGFDIKPTQSAICAVMLYDAKPIAIVRRTNARRRHLCNGVLLSCRSAGPSPHTGTTFGRSQEGRTRRLYQGIH